MHTPLSCPNCHSPLAKEHTFCSHCGQKVGPLRVTVRQILREFLETAVMIDNRLWSTLRGMAKPGFLSREWTAGRRQRYIAPVRFFLVIMLLHLAMIRFTVSPKLFDVENGDITSRFHELEALKHSLDWWEKQCGQDTSLATLHPAICDSAVTTLQQEITRRGETPILTFNIPFIFHNEIKLTEEDLTGEPIDTLVKRHGLTRFREKLVLNQLVQLMRHPDKFGLFLIGNLSWMILLLVPSMALLLLLLYIRNQYYYVEHLVFNIHWHAAAFLGVSVGMILDKMFAWHTLPFFFVAALVWLFLSLKRYYGQGYFKTMVKMGIYGFGYFCLALAYFIALLIVTFLIFT